MLTLLGYPRRCCDGITRRQCLQAGALGVLGGLGLPDLLRAEAARHGRTRPGKAKNVLVLFLLGGAASQDMYDLKPNAPDKIRGEFKPIATNVPGIQIGEHLPRMAHWMHKSALVRSLHHNAGCHNPMPVLTGYDTPLNNLAINDNYPPNMGAVCEYLKKDRSEVPASVFLPHYPGWGSSNLVPGATAGFLGRRYDPFFTESNIHLDHEVPHTQHINLWLGEPRIANSGVEGGIVLDRLDRRRTLLAQLDGQFRRAEANPVLKRFDRHQQRAFSFLTSKKLKEAFDLDRVDARLRDRYGRTLFGNSTLVGTRLLDAGARFVTVTWEWYDRLIRNDQGWDTHTKNFEALRTVLLPNLDQTFSALMEDLDGRGLLDETLVAVLSDFGRTPQITGNAGRDHWTFCYSVLLAGAGIRGGTVYGASDAHAAFVKDNPVRPADICATIYECLGVNPEMPIYDKGGRPQPVAQGGKRIREILA